jgi:hypothetical protein
MDRIHPGGFEVLRKPHCHERLACSSTNLAQFCYLLPAIQSQATGPTISFATQVDVPKVLQLVYEIPKFLEVPGEDEG